jgi:prevent-host-death family protein
MRKLSAGDARERFAEIVNEAAYADKRTVITRHGKEVAAIVPITDLNQAAPPSAKLPDGSVIISQTPEILTYSAPSVPNVHLSFSNND